MRFRRFRPALVAAVLAIQAPAPAAATGAEDPDSWRTLRFRRIERETRYTWQAERAGWLAEAECSASARVLPLDPPVELGRTPRLVWQWRVLAAFENTDEHTKAGDDFAARLSVLLRRPPGKVSLLQRARRRAARLLFGEGVPDRALNFVWTQQAEVGTRWWSPYAPDEARTVAVSTGPAGPGWREVRVDVAAELALAFPDEELEPYAVAIMTDADNRCAEARAEYGPPRWQP